MQRRYTTLGRDILRFQPLPETSVSVLDTVGCKHHLAVSPFRGAVYPI